MNTIPKRRKAVRENIVEDYLVTQVEAAGGVAEKVIALGSRGYFDRLVVLPGGRVVFVEVKRPRGGRTSHHQRLRHENYRRLGGEVWVLKTFAEVDALVAG